MRNRCPSPWENEETTRNRCPSPWEGSTMRNMCPSPWGTHREGYHCSHTLRYTRREAYTTVHTLVHTQGGIYTTVAHPEVHRGIYTTGAHPAVYPGLIPPYIHPRYTRGGVPRPLLFPFHCWPVLSLLASLSPCFIPERSPFASLSPVLYQKEAFLPLRTMGFSLFCSLSASQEQWF